MAARKRRRSVARKRREQRLKAGLIGGVVCVVLLVVFWQVIWPYLVSGLLLIGAAVGGWWLWRTNRLVQGRDHQWRHEEAVKAGHRTLSEVDVMSGGEFEDFVVDLCRRDGCTEVRRVGGSHDDGADVLGHLPDGRSMVMQCKRYFTGPSERTAVQNGVVAVHRDHLGMWNNGASLLSLNDVNGAGQGDRRHRARWKETYE